MVLYERNPHAGRHSAAGEGTHTGIKNAALPILAATLLTNEVSYIQNCPRIADVHRFVHLLRELGCLVHWQEKGIRVQPGENEELPCERAEARRMQGEAITGMRSSLCLLGALLGRCGYVTMEHPGGCIIGERPIDLHIRALQQMGVEFREEEGLLSAQVKDGKMHGAEITLEFPSVGATENILLAAVKADGDTRILGAAREPEVTALCKFLTACGAQIEGIGETELLVHGDRPLHGTQFTVPADRIVAGTYLFACIGCGGSTLLTEAPWEQMEAVTFVAEKWVHSVLPRRKACSYSVPKGRRPYHICGLGHTRSSPRICSRWQWRC